MGTTSTTTATTYRLADGTKVFAEPVDGRHLQPGDVVLLWCGGHVDPSPHRVIEPQEPIPSVALEPVDGGGAVIKDRGAGPFWRIIPDGTQ